MKLGEIKTIEGVKVKLTTPEPGTDETNNCKGCYFKYGEFNCWLSLYDQECGEDGIFKEVKYDRRS